MGDGTLVHALRRVYSENQSPVAHTRGYGEARDGPASFRCREARIVVGLCRPYVPPISSVRGRFAALALALACLVLQPPSVLAAQELRIRFLNVGQGDATLIATPEGRQVLIDAGPNRHAVAAFLAAEGIDTLDLVVASHAHADHIGGMTEVLRTAVVRFYMDNGMPHSTATYQRTLAALTASGAQYLEASSRTLTVGSIGFRVLAPPAGTHDQNDASVGVLLQFGAFRALFTGDSELGELRHWLTHDSIPAVQVLKVAHHGSRNTSSPAWAEATRPALAVIPVGARNRYGHPSPGVVALWSAVGATVMRTDQHGTIEIQADSTGHFTVSTALGTWPSDSLVLVPR